MKPKERPRLDSEAIPNFLELRNAEVRLGSTDFPRKGQRPDLSRPPIRPRLDVPEEPPHPIS